MTDETSEVSTSLSKDGIVVYQTYSTDRFEVPTVAIKLVSDREVPVSIRLVVRLPVEIKEVGIHSNFHHENWTLSEEQMTFSTDLDPQEELTTIYAIKSGHPENVSELLDNLYIADIQPLDPVDETDAKTDAGIIGPEASGSATKTQSEDKEPIQHPQVGESSDSSQPEEPTGVEVSTETGDRESSPQEATQGLRNPERTKPEGTTETESEDSKPTTEQDPESMTPETGTNDEKTASPDLSALPTAKLVSEIKNRLEEDALSKREQEDLRKEVLEGSETDPTTLDVRVSHLQQRLSDTEAFIESIQEIHEEHGRLGETIDDLYGELAEVTQRMDDLAERVETVDNQMGRMEDRLDSVDEQTANTEERLETVNDDVDTILTRQERLDEQVSNLQTWKDEVASALKALSQSD